MAKRKQTKKIPIEHLRIVVNGKVRIRPMLVGVDANGKEHYIKYLGDQQLESLINDPHVEGLYVENLWGEK